MLSVSEKLRIANLKRKADKILLITLGFWILYTIIFLFIDGWHVKPISKIERYCDIITDIGVIIALLYYSMIWHILIKGITKI